MKLLAPGDFAIWRRKRICRILRESDRAASSFFAPSSSVADIRPAGINDEDYAEIRNMTSSWIAQDERNGEEFEASGADLLYVNEMQLIALMSKVKDSPSTSSSPGEQKEGQ